MVCILVHWSADDHMRVSWMTSQRLSLPSMIPCGEFLLVPGAAELMVWMVFCLLPTETHFFYSYHIVAYPGNVRGTKPPILWNFNMLITCKTFLSILHLSNYNYTVNTGSFYKSGSGGEGVKLLEHVWRESFPKHIRPQDRWNDNATSAYLSHSTWYDWKDRSSQQSTTHFGCTVPVSGPARLAVIELLLLEKVWHWKWWFTWVVSCFCCHRIFICFSAKMNKLNVVWLISQWHVLVCNKNYLRRRILYMLRRQLSKKQQHAYWKYLLLLFFSSRC